MRRTGASRATSESVPLAVADPTSVGPTRLARTERRDVLLDAAAALVADGDIDALSMDSVAERAGVSRPLVYKHFPNRGELLAAVYRREAALLHRELAAAVAEADTVGAKFRALIHGALQAEAERGGALSALRAAGGPHHALRNEQRTRDRGTVAHFARQAMREYRIDEQHAKGAVSILLRAIEGVLAEWRLRPTAARAELLEDTYVTIAVGALERLATSRGAENRPAATAKSPLRSKR